MTFAILRIHLSFIPEAESKPKQTSVRGHRKRSQDHHNVPTCSEFLLIQAVLTDLREELLIALLPSKPAGKEDTRSVDGEESADGVELGREDLKDDEGERELAQCCTDVGSFEGSLRCSDFHELVVSQNYGSGAMHSQVVIVRGIVLGFISSFQYRISFELHTSNILEVMGTRSVGKESKLRYKGIRCGALNGEVPLQNAPLAPPSKMSCILYG